MFQHIYQLVYENGDIVMEVRSDYTYLNFDIYAQKFVVPMMQALAHALHEDRVQRTDGDCGELKRVYYTGITEGDPE
jgi:hypothetical protein